MLKVYGTPMCPDCRECKANFDHHGIAYENIDICESLRGLKEFLDRTKKPELFYQAYYMRCIFFFLESMDMDYMNPENTRPLKERLRKMKEKMQEEPFAGAVTHVDRKYLSLPKQVPVFLMKHRLPALLALFYRIYRKMK